MSSSQNYQIGLFNSVLFPLSSSSPSFLQRTLIFFPAAIRLQPWCQYYLQEWPKYY